MHESCCRRRAKILVPCALVFTKPHVQLMFGWVASDGDDIGGINQGMVVAFSEYLVVVYHVISSNPPNGHADQITNKVFSVPSYGPLLQSLTDYQSAPDKYVVVNEDNYDYTIQASLISCCDNRVISNCTLLSATAFAVICHVFPQIHHSILARIWRCRGMNCGRCFGH